VFGRTRDKRFIVETYSPTESGVGPQRGKSIKMCHVGSITVDIVN
jgi:hypothetical protein